MKIHEGVSRPHNDEAEQQLLGILLVDNDKYDDVASLVRPEFFHAPVHGRIFNAIEKDILAGRAVNAVTAGEYFKSDPDLVNAGGADYLRRLADAVISTIGAVEYAETVRECYLRYELICLSKNVRHEATHRDQSKPALEIIQTAEDTLFGLAERGEAERGSMTLAASMRETIERISMAQKGEITGISTGLAAVDELIGGFNAPDLWILGGRPSMGKSALALNYAENAAKRWAETGGEEGARVLLFSLEMPHDQLTARILAGRTGIPTQPQMRKGGLTDAQFMRLAEAAGTLQDIPLHIDDEGGLNIVQIANRCRRHKRRHGLDLVIIDHLHMMSDAGDHRGNKVESISERSKGAQRLAKALGVPVLMLCQLSRGPETREDKRPTLADLREGGSLEEDAAGVMFVFRDEYYLERTVPRQRSSESADKFNERYARWEEQLDRARGKAEVIIAKIRQGTVGTAKVAFSGKDQKFSNLERMED